MMDYNIPEGGIPMVAFGEGANTSLEVMNLLKPEYDLIHVCNDIQHAVSELPRIMAGDQDLLPSSTIGTNMCRDAGARPLPRAIIIAEDVEEDEYERVRRAVEAKIGEDRRDFQWVRVSTMTFGGFGGGGGAFGGGVSLGGAEDEGEEKKAASPHVIASVLRKELLDRFGNPK